MVGLQDQVAPFVAGADRVGFPAIRGVVHFLIEVVGAVVGVVAAAARLTSQVPQGVIGISPGGAAVVIVGRHQPVQSVVGIGGVILSLPGTIATHILMNQIAVGITLAGVLPRVLASFSPGCVSSTASRRPMLS